MCSGRGPGRSGETGREGGSPWRSTPPVTWLGLLACVAAVREREGGWSNSCKVSLGTLAGAAHATCLVDIGVSWVLAGVQRGSQALVGGCLHRKPSGTGTAHQTDRRRGRGQVTRQQDKRKKHCLCSSCSPLTLLTVDCMSTLREPHLLNLLASGGGWRRRREEAGKVWRRRRATQWLAKIMHSATVSCISRG